MSTAQRDIQFAGFAKLLRERLMKTNAVDIVDGHRFWQEEEIAELELLFAQSGYDLVKHAVRCGCTDSVHWVMQHKLDMTELPKGKSDES